MKKAKLVQMHLMIPLKMHVFVLCLLYSECHFSILDDIYELVDPVVSLFLFIYSFIFNGMISVEHLTYKTI